VVSVFDASGQLVIRLSNPDHVIRPEEAQVVSTYKPIYFDKENQYQFKLLTQKKDNAPVNYKLIADYDLKTLKSSLVGPLKISVYQDFPDFAQLIQQNVGENKQSFTLISPLGEVMASGGIAELNGKIASPLLEEFIRLPLGGTHHIAGAKEEDLDKDGAKEPSHHKVLMKLPSTGWGIILETPYALQKEYIRLAQMQTIFLVLGCVMLIVLLGLWYSRSIYRNFRQLIKGIQALAEGNYARQIRLITRAFTPFEIIYLTSEFNRMAHKISQAWEDIQNLNLALADANTKLAKLDETKSNLIDTVSHELRTPLTSIKGYTSRLIRSYDQISKEDQIKNLKVVKQQADRLGRMVEDLLVIPELEQGGGFRVYMDTFDVKEQLRRSVALIQDKSEQTIDLSLPAEPVLITADPDRMEQVILNILDNAAKYAPIGSIIRVGLTTVPYGDRPYAQMSFLNASEYLIDPDTAKSLFDKFTRLDERLTRTTRGTGLGLFITKSLVEVMGGEIQLNTESGFLINVLMPLYQPNEPNKVNSQALQTITP
jgi:signal transduction histidine kinase